MIIIETEFKKDIALMQKFLKIFLLIPLITLNAQRIGEMAPPPEPIVFPPNALGVDLMFGDGGFGIGSFYRHSLAIDLSWFVDFSISESKDTREVEYIDYFGQIRTIGKKNRVFTIPLNFGLQYRLFEEVLTDNLRPYINFGIGPNFIITTPYDQEFFSAFGDAQFKVAAGGYIGFGADFGLSKSSLFGINARYYYAHLFDEGVESLEGRIRKDIAHFYLTLNIGWMY